MTTPRLVVIGPLPPPIHGVTVSTSLVLKNEPLHDLFDVIHVDTSDHRDRANLGRWDVTNVTIGIKNVTVLIRALRGEPGAIYLPISANTGAFLRDSLFIGLASLRGWRVAIHLRGSEILPFYESQGRVFRWWARRTFGLITSGAVMGESLRDVFGPLLAPDRVAVVSNGTPPFARCPNSTSDPSTVLFLSNLRRRKGVREAVEASILTAERVPDARFLFAGAWEDDDLERELRARTSAFGERIEFRGHVSGHEKDELLAMSGVLLFPPTEPEGHPRVVLEALAAGMPVVTTDQGAIAETVEDGVSGFVLANPDPMVLADRLVRLLENPDLYRSMSRAALTRYEERFTQEAADRRLTEWLVDVAVAKRS